MKINIILFVLSGLVAVGVGGYVLMAYNTKSSTVPASPDRSMADAAFEYMSDTQPITGTDTLASLLEIGKDIECSFVFADSAVYSEGTGFFADGKIRVDALSRDTAGEIYLSKMIIQSDTIYVWGESEIGEYAIRMPAISTTNASLSESEYLTADESVSYTCRPWTVDGSIFVPPANLDFFDISTFMGTVPKDI